MLNKLINDIKQEAAHAALVHCCGLGRMERRHQEVVGHCTICRARNAIGYTCKSCLHAKVCINCFPVAFQRRVVEKHDATDGIIIEYSCPFCNQAFANLPTVP